MVHLFSIQLSFEADELVFERKSVRFTYMLLLDSHIRPSLLETMCLLYHVQDLIYSRSPIFIRLLRPIRSDQIQEKP